jgi:hypothetical protein
MVNTKEGCVVPSNPPAATPRFVLPPLTVRRDRFDSLEREYRYRTRTATNRLYCSADTGLTRVARRAGSQAAIVVTVMTASVAKAMTNGSVGSRPKSNDRR